MASSKPKVIRLHNEDNTQEWVVPVRDRLPDLNLDIEDKYSVEISLLLFLDMAEAAYGMLPVIKEPEDEPDDRTVNDIVNGGWTE